MNWWEEQEPYTPYCYGEFRNIKYLYLCYSCDYCVACSRVWLSKRPKHGKLWRVARALWAMTLGRFFPIAC